MAGRRLPIRRALAAAIALSALGAVPAVAQDWIAVPTPGSSQPAAGWTSTPSGDVWQVTPGDAREAAPAVPSSEPAPAEVVPSDILSNFAAVAQRSTASEAAPPAPPAAVAVPETAAPEVQLEADHPALVALRAAEDELNTVAGTLADVRTRIETAGPSAAEDLAAEAATLEKRQRALQAKVDAAQAKVDAALAAKRKKAAEEAARAAQAQALTSATGYPLVTGTVPSINPGLASQLDGYLQSKGSPLAGLGNAFVYYGGQSGVDPRFLVAIAGAETSFGTYGPSQRIHNPFGMGPGIVYASWEDGIAGAARNLGGSLYKGSGLLTAAQIQKRWAPNGAANDPTNLNSHWFTNVSMYYRELGGDPNGSVFIGQAAQPTAIPVAPGVAPGIQGTVAAPTAYGMAVPVPGGGRNTGPAAVALAQTFLGVPYLWGGTTPRGFDCSGLVQYVYAKQGVTLPRVAEAQAKVGTAIAPENLQPGDAVFFADRKGYIHHEGMYVGDGHFIHAPRTGDVVKISSLHEPYYATSYAGARRY